MLRTPALEITIAQCPAGSVNTAFLRHVATGTVFPHVPTRRAGTVVRVVGAAIPLATGITTVAARRPPNAAKLRQANGYP